MNVKIIEATEPDVIPSVAERICNMWAMRHLNIGGNEFPLLNMSIELNKCGADNAGHVWSLSPNTVLNYSDVFATAAENPKLAQAMNLLNEFIEDELTRLELK